MERRKWALRILAAGAFSVVAWLALKVDPRVEALNQALHDAGSPRLLAYPYQFRVVRVEGDKAVMSTPRSQTVPVYRMISALYPHLAGRSSTSPEYVAAQQELADIQFEARGIVQQQPGISKVEWELDQSWLIQHNIPLN